MITNQELLKLKLKENNMTAMQLSIKLGVHNSVISKLIHGHQTFTQSYITKLNEIFSTNEFKIKSKYNIGEKVIVKTEGYSYIIEDIKQDFNSNILYKLNNKKEKLYAENILKPFNPPYNKGDKVKLYNGMKVEIYSCTGYSKEQYNYCFYTDEGQCKFFKDKDIIADINPLQAPKIEFKEDSLTFFKEDLGSLTFSKESEPCEPKPITPEPNKLDLLIDKINIDNLSPEEAKLLALAKAKEMLK